MHLIMAAILMSYLVLMSLIGFAMMGIDKQKARKRAWRIPEKVLLGTAFAGGGIGSFLGMYAFRHKTRHTKFVVLLPMAAVLYVFVLYQMYQLI